jgi:hypothetical protein
MEKIPTPPTPSEEPTTPESLTLPEELTLEEKRLIADAWSVGVTGTEAPENPEAFSNEEMKEWLEDSLMEGVAHFADDVGIKPNDELLHQMKHAETLDERVSIEEQYLQDIQRQMNTVKNRVQAERGKRETRWDSWPTTMREHQTWNCVGGTLVATHLLKDTEITNYCGATPGHILNILQLSNGDWWYADFTNNSVFKIEPNEGMVGEMKTITLKDKRARYSFIGLSENGDIINAILGNVASMRKEAVDPNKQGEGKDNAVAEMRKFGDLFSEAPFSTTRSKLYPEYQNFVESKQYKAEEKRVEQLDYETPEIRKLLDRFAGPIAELVSTLTSEEVIDLQQVARTNVQDIETLLLATPNEARARLESLNLPERLTEIITVRINQLEELLTSGDQTTHETLLTHTIRKWHNI